MGLGRSLPRHLSSHFGEVKTPGPLGLEAHFQYTHAEEAKSQGLLLTDPRMGVQ